MLFRQDIFLQFTTDVGQAIFSGMIIFGFIIIYQIFKNIINK